MKFCDRNRVFALNAVDKYRTKQKLHTNKWKHKQISQNCMMLSTADSGKEPGNSGGNACEFA